jgi:hypothetical protein
VLHALIWAIAGRLQHCVDKAHNKQEQRKDEYFGTSYQRQHEVKRGPNGQN